MRLLLLTLLLACLMVELVRGQKGGAKGAMRNRGRGGGGAGRRGGGGAAGEEEDDEFIEKMLERYDYSKPRPCVGLCFIKKLQGKGPIEYLKKEDRTPCVGMCHRNKLKGIRRVKRIERREKPCVGMCHRERLKKKRQRTRV